MCVSFYIDMWIYVCVCVYAFDGCVSAFYIDMWIYNCAFDVCVSLHIDMCIHICALIFACLTTLCVPIFDVLILAY